MKLDHSGSGRMLSALIALAAIAMLQSNLTVRAQSMFGNGAAPMYGSSGGLSVPNQAPRLSISPNTPAHVHLSVTGRACLRVEGQVEQQKLNPNIYNHAIIGVNKCGQPIAVKVCYYQTDDCTQMTVPAYGEKRTLLGIMPAMKDFRFEYTEKFDDTFRAF